MSAGRSQDSRSSQLSPEEEAFLDDPVAKPSWATIFSKRTKKQRTIGFAVFDRKINPKGDIVFFHGTPGSRLDAAYLDDAASALGVRIVSIDRPGAGGSSEEPLRTIRSFSQDVQKLLRNLSTPVFDFYLIAHSAGAAYALALADIFPARRLLGIAIVSGLAPAPIAQKHLPTQAIALLHTATHGSPEEGQALVKSQADAFTQGSARERYDIMKIALGSSSVDYDALVEPRMARIWLQSQYEAYKNTSRKNGLLLEAKLLWSDWNIRLDKLKYKGIRFYYGSEDTTTNLAMGSAFAKEVPYSKLIKYEGAGHYSILITCGVEIIQDLLKGRPATIPRPVRYLERKPSQDPREIARRDGKKVVYKYVR